MPSPSGSAGPPPGRLRVRRRRARARRRGRRLPWPLLLPAALGALLVLLPLVGLVWRAPWHSLPRLLGAPGELDALWLSVRTATASTAVSVLVGVPLAWLLARVEFPGRALARALVTLPMVLPPVVGGVALLLAAGRRGVAGQFLYQGFGISLPFTTTAVVIAQTFVAMPFLVVAVEGALEGTDQRYEDAAATLGASAWYTFRRVTLPAIGPSVGAGAVLCWARALGEFGATITFAGNLPGSTQTMPLAVYAAMQSDPDAAIALSMVLLATSVVVLTALRARWLTAATRAVRRPATPVEEVEAAGRTRGPTSDNAATLGSPGPAAAGDAGLRARVVADRGAFTLDVELRVAPGEVVAVLGPNGAGKSSLLGALAGLLPLCAGEVALDGEMLDDPATDRYVEPRHRPVGFVFQDYLLFGHMSVRENIAFGPRARRLAGRQAAGAAADGWLARMGLAGLGARPPAALSGGQAQRVALARALATGPRLLLLDEPLAALDATTRGDLRAFLRTTLPTTGAAVVLVTHDPADAAALADRLVILESGEVAATGTAAALAADPPTPYVARLFASLVHPMAGLP
jgi:molybdate transport system permease protein